MNGWDGLWCIEIHIVIDANGHGIVAMGDADAFWNLTALLIPLPLPKTITTV